MRKNIIAAISTVSKNCTIRVVSVYNTSLSKGEKYQIVQEPIQLACLVFMTAGSLTIHMKNQDKINLKQNEVIFTKNSDILGYIVTSDNSMFYWLYFEIDGIDLPYGNVYEHVFAERDTETMMELRKYIECQDSRNYLKANSLLFSYVIDVLDSVDNEEFNKPYYSELLDAYHYINTNYDKKICIADLAKRSFLSTKYFCKLFKRYFGVVPLQHVIAQKMKYAQWYLLHTTNTVTEIATLLAFDSPFYFSNAFKKQFGCSPSFYRKKYMEQHY